jgi:hypothetical protein
MSGDESGIRDLLAGKNLIGFKNVSEQGNRAVQRASSAKVTIVKSPKKANSSEQD